MNFCIEIFAQIGTFKQGRMYEVRLTDKSTHSPL